MPNKHTNLFKTSLVGGYTNTETVITVSDASGLTEFPTKLVIFNNQTGDPADAFQAGEAEIVNATGKNGNDVTIERGQENTSGVSLSDDWVVYQTITAETIDGKEPTFTKNTAFNKDFGSSADTVTEGNDARLSDAREWTADTVTQVEAEAGTDTTRKAWTVQRVWQAINSWWNDVSIAISKVTGLQGELDSKADLEGGNTFSGTQRVDGDGESDTILQRLRRGNLNLSRLDFTHFTIQRRANNNDPNIMVLQPDGGNLGIGKNPTAKLDVDGDIKFGSGTDLQTTLNSKANLEGGNTFSGEQGVASDNSRIVTKHIGTTGDNQKVFLLGLKDVSNSSNRSYMAGRIIGGGSSGQTNRGRYLLDVCFINDTGDNARCFFDYRDNTGQKDDVQLIECTYEGSVYFAIKIDGTSSAFFARDHFFHGNVVTGQNQEMPKAVNLSDVSAINLNPQTAVSAYQKTNADISEFDGNIIFNGGTNLQTALDGKADINPTKNKSFIFTESDFSGDFLDTEQIRIRLKNGSRSFDFFDLTFAGWRSSNTTAFQIAINAKIIAGVTTLNELYLSDMNESVNVVHSYGTVDVAVEAVGSNGEFDLKLTFNTAAGDLNNYTLELRATTSNSNLELIEAVKETA